jgi:hypothetical protein
VECKKNATNGRIVAGGNEKGDRLNQLNTPYYIFIDEDYSVHFENINQSNIFVYMCAM